MYFFSLYHATYIGGEEILKSNLKEKKQATDLTIRINDKNRIIVEMKISGCLYLHYKCSFWHSQELNEWIHRFLFQYALLHLLI